MTTRRQFTKVVLGGSLMGLAGQRGVRAASVQGADQPVGRFDQGKPDEKIKSRLVDIEASTSGRLGVAILDTTTGMTAGNRSHERFPMCSTFKFLAAAAVLERQQKHKESLQLRVIFGASDVVANSPITQARTGGAGMTLAELCEAAITMSDNTAGNLLLARIGGPPGLTAFARRLGDPTTRLDRIEPALNEARPGDLRDTTTPAAMLGNMHRLLIGGDVLTSASQSRLGAWLAANRTGDARIRARLPQDWRVGDKTGSGNHGSTNDIAILWPPGRGPILACIYLTESSAPDGVRNAALAAVGGLVAASL